MKKATFAYQVVDYDDYNITIGKQQFQIISLSLKRSDFRSAVVDTGDLVELEATIAVDWTLNSLACREGVRETAKISLGWDDPIWGPKRWIVEGPADFVNALIQEGVKPISEEEVRGQPTEGRKAPAAKKPPKRA